MSNIILVFQSITIAMNARKILRGVGIKGSIKKTTKSGYNDGCGYGLEILASDYFMAISILQRSGINYSLAQQ